MSFSTNHQVLSLIKNQDNDKAKTLINNENLHNAVDPTRNTLLHYAVEYCNTEIVQFLVDSNSKVNAQNDLDQTPLMKSFESDLPSKEVIEILLKAGANFYMVDITGKPCLLDTINSIQWLNEDVRRFEILKVFIKYEKLDLASFGILIDGNKDVIKTLLQSKFNLFTESMTLVTVVHMLALNHNPGVIELLHDEHYDVNVHDFDGWTPLMCATNSCNIPAVEFLLSQGADIDARNTSQETALYLAIANNINRYPDIKRNIQILLEHGADIQIETNDERYKTIFDLIKNNDELSFQVVGLLLAHLALQERHGMTITDLIRTKINADQRYKNYLENCQKQLSVAIYSSFTLFNILTASDKQFERFYRKEDLASTSIDLLTKIEYFDTIVRKRLSKASRIINLKKESAEIVSQLMKMDYNCYPSIIDNIVNFLDEKVYEFLISVKNEIF